MKKIFTHMHLCLLAVITMLIVSCEKEKLSDVMVNEEAASVSLSLDDKIEIGSGNNFTLDQGQLTVPVTINFTSASTRAFNVQISSSLDTIATLVANGTLPAEIIPFETGTFNLPPVVDIAYGVKSVTFDLVISRSFLEINHGKDIAIAVKMIDPAKGNSITPGKNATIVIIKTAEAITAGDVHYISFTAAGSLYLVPNGVNYAIGSQDLTIPIELALSGVAGPDFTVDAAPDASAVNALINNGTLKNTVLLDANNYGFTNAKVRFSAAKNSASLGLTARISEMLKISGKKVAIGITLKTPSKFQLNATKKTIVVVIDPDHFRPYNGTPFLIKGTIGAVSDLIPAAQYDLGGEGTAYHDNGGKDGVADYRSPDQVDVGDYTPRSVVGWTADGEWLTFSVNVEADGEYELNSMIGAPGDNGRYTIFFDGVDITGELPVKQTPGAHADQQPNLTTVQLKKGIHIMKFYENVAAYDVRGWIFTRKK